MWRFRHHLISEYRRQVGVFPLSILIIAVPQLSTVSSTQSDGVIKTPFI
ncbi:MAG: hypothetical protein JXK92_06430 [Erysipelotrichaceae bacterium]|nr:hypothetical protein [Erysipelotrichaceae bacterium]